MLVWWNNCIVSHLFVVSVTHILPITKGYHGEDMLVYQDRKWLHATNLIDPLLPSDVLWCLSDRRAYRVECCTVVSPPTAKSGICFLFLFIFRNAPALMDYLMPPPFRNANVCLLLRLTKEIMIMFFHSIFNTTYINTLDIRMLGGVCQPQPIVWVTCFANSGGRGECLCCT